jgi:hypothetical protein
MPDRPADGESFPKDRYENPETALGGADAVEKTSYVTGSGTDPERTDPTPVNQRKGEGSVTANVAAGGGQGATWAIIVFLLVGAVLVYLLGFGR